ncbi:MAG: DNA primase catalytic subunit PriS [Methanomassiliicoccales archaeon]
MKSDHAASSNDTEFIINQFKKYYLESPPPPPDRFGRREFGFMFFEKEFVQRHIAFSKLNDLHSFLVSRVPAHVYYSSAYYEFPSAPTMEAKKWLGADLVFDLDADHLKGAENLAYGDMLAAVKREIIRLLDDFLMGDLGFSSDSIRIVFSGGRGYHVHVHDERVIGLKSHERREIVDYITGTDLDVEWVFPTEVFEKRQFKHITKVGISRKIPPLGSVAWRKRFRIGLESLLDEIRDLSIQEMKERYDALKSYPDKLIEKMIEDLSDDDWTAARRIFEKNTLEVFSSDKIRELFVNFAFNTLKSRMAGHVDEPVTSDIKRLIRLPFSLHGKTGLVVVGMDRDGLDKFEPLRDAVPKIFADDPVRIHVHRRVDIRLKNERFVLEGDTEVPTFAALFLICRKEATLA